VHEEVLGQVKSEATVECVSSLLAKGVLRLYPWSEADEVEFVTLRSQVSSNSRAYKVKFDHWY